MAMGMIRTCYHLALIACSNFYKKWMQRVKYPYNTCQPFLYLFKRPLSDWHDNWHGRSCVEGCEKNGCVNGLCFDNCKSSVNISANGKPYLRWTLDTPQDLLKWDCTGECRYQCMLQEESSRDSSADPIKYHGKWPFLRILNIQVHWTIL